MTPEKKFVEQGGSVFTAQALGVATNRDAWVYAFSKEVLTEQMEKTIACFNRSLGGERSLDPSEISWATNLQKAHEAGKRQSFNAQNIRLAAYRPFQKQWQYFDQLWNERRGVMPKLFPTGERGENLVICTGGLGSTKSRTCLVTDVTPDLNMMDAGTQCFPLYWYEEGEADLFKKTVVRHDGVSDWVRRLAERQYRATVGKEEIFYYVYGYLHKRDYREAFAADLKKSLPRIPLVERLEDFRKIAEVGRRLAALHLNYETLDPYPLEEVGDFAERRIVKMAFPKKDRSRIVVNATLTLAGIPV